MRSSVYRRRRGVAIVEFAVVVPLLLLLFFAMVEFSRLIMVQQVLTNASREGARMAVLDGATTGSVETAVNHYLAGSSIRGASILFSPTNPATAGYGEPVTVTVRVTAGQVGWLSTPMYITGSSWLSASTTMRRETVQ